ncbi:Eukaryotic translation initiation factor 2 subunit beta [Raphanus sativus]|nr:Eukaryotic translation initiation factor 2 subunit beta [Raphanus sativus]
MDNATNKRKKKQEASPSSTSLRCALFPVCVIMADEINDMQQELAPFDPTKKKKKKKVVLQDHAESSTESQMEKADDSVPAAVNDGLESTLTGMKDNKKPVDSSSLNEESVEAVEDLDGDHEEEEGVIQQENRYPWEGSDRFYLYEEMLGRVFNILREHNPDLTGNRRRTVMRPPQVLREGTKKTVFVNFMDLCKTMHRQPDHVMAFLLSELGTSGSLDGQQRLVVKGRFAPKSFESNLRKYVNNYVICLGCKSPNTNLTKENRLFFMRCEQCGSERSVEQIKAGYVALVGKRKT